MGWGEKSTPRVECPVHQDHVAANRARTRIQAMATHDLYDWATNVATDLHQLLDKAREGDLDAVEMLSLCDAMMHACVAEITYRRTP